MSNLLADLNDQQREAVATTEGFVRVIHFIMGAGEVVDIDHNKGAYIIKFDDIPTPRKISIKAQLEAAQ